MGYYITADGKCKKRVVVSGPFLSEEEAAERLNRSLRLMRHQDPTFVGLNPRIEELANGLVFARLPLDRVLAVDKVKVPQDTWDFFKTFLSPEEEVELKGVYRDGKVEVTPTIAHTIRVVLHRILQSPNKIEPIKIRQLQIFLRNLEKVFR